MTEEEAKTKWCPHVVASHTDPRQGPSQYEREAGVTSPFRHNCIASACMAWRTVGECFDTTTGERTHDYGNPNAAYRTVGYCGLAGFPQ